MAIMPATTSWADVLLAGLNAPNSPNNQSKLAAWNACEGNLNGGSGLGINNPFNTTLDYGGGSSVNSVGVKAYPSISVGIQATLMTLGAPRYAAIVANLQKDGPGGEFASAVGSSGWGTSGACIARTLGTVAVAPADAPATLTAKTTGTTPKQTPQQNENKDISRMNLVTAIATYGPGILTNEDLQKKMQVGGSASSILKNIPGLGGLFTAGSDVVSGTEVAAGILAWLTKPSTLLRGGEILLGAGLLAVGGAMYLRILMPAVGGIVGGIAAAATPIGRAAGAGQSMVKTAGTRRDARAAQRRTAAARQRRDDYQDLTMGTKEVRAQTARMKAERAQIEHLQPRVPKGALAGPVSRTHNELGEEYF